MDALVRLKETHSGVDLDELFSSSVAPFLNTTITATSTTTTTTIASVVRDNTVAASNQSLALPDVFVNVTFQLVSNISTTVASMP